MQIVRFTKFWSDCSAAEIGQRAAGLGYDGLDLVVRDGHPITPENAPQALPAAVRGWAEAGLACALLTGDTTLTDPHAGSAMRLFAAAAAAGVPAIKIGYFVYRPEAEFEAQWDQARRALEGFESLARDTGVRALYHTHSGLCLGSNCAGLRHLIGEHDPRWVGAYPDLGHLAVNGEDVRLGLPMLRTHLAAVAAKDARHLADQRPERRAAYTDAFVPLGDGAAECADALALLHGWGFGGPLSVHTEYTLDPSVIARVGGRDDSPEAQTLRARGEQQDLACLRRLLAPLRVHFVHGLEGSPQGNKARLLAQHFDASTPAMDTADFEGCVAVHAARLAERRPDVLVGSSFGGAVAVALLQRGHWHGPTLLLAQAAVARGLPRSLPRGVPVWIVHGGDDEVVPPAHSRELARANPGGRVRLIEVDDDHSLHHSTASGALVGWVRALHGWAGAGDPAAGSPAAAAQGR